MCSNDIEKEKARQVNNENTDLKTEPYNEIINRLDDMAVNISGISQLAQMFLEKTAFENEKQEFINNLFTEPARYKDDFFFDIIKPLIISIIRFKDGLEKDIYNFEASASGTKIDDETLKFINIFKSASRDIADILEIYDIFEFKCEDKKFNPLKQLAVKTIPTDDASLFKTVCESLSYGYERNGHVISKEKTAVYAVKID